MSYLWLLFALLSAVSASLVSIFGKIGLKNLDSNTATAVRAVIMALFLLAVILVQGKASRLPEVFSDKRALGFIALSGIAGATSWLLYFLALKFGRVSQVAPVDKLSVVFAILLGIFVLGEKLSLAAGAGVCLITVGVVLVALG